MKLSTAIALTLSLTISLTSFAQIDELNISTEYKTDIVAKLAEMLEAQYVNPEQAIVVANELRQRFDSGVFDDISTLADLANAMTAALDVIDDWHLGVNYFVQPIPEDYDSSNLPDDERRRFRDFQRQRNYGFEKVERLAGNIGYLDFRDFFYSEPYSEQLMASTMRLVENTDALIIDLRRNGGGDPKMVDLFISYLVKSKVHINSIHHRKDNRIDEHWTLDDVEGPRYSKPIYVLTSEWTFSAAESFAYALQSLERATVIGEETIGGAHPTKDVRLDTHLMIRMPYAAAIDPRTQSNWQSVGIQPDQEVTADEALDFAHIQLLELSLLSADEGNSKREKEFALEQLTVPAQ
jgi:retinol-binding protein 3